MSPQGPSTCPDCGGANMWLMQSRSYYFCWPECEDCGWRGEMRPVPDSQRPASDAALDKRKPLTAL